MLLASVYDDEREIIALTNKERAAQQLPPLRENAILRKVAEAHSANMARQQNMDHRLDGRTPKDRILAAGYQYSSMGENIAYNFDTPQAVLQGWMNSPGHRANILDKDFTEIGVGIATDKDGHPYYTQEFGQPDGVSTSDQVQYTAPPPAPVAVTFKRPMVPTQNAPSGDASSHADAPSRTPVPQYDRASKLIFTPVNSSFTTSSRGGSDWSTSQKAAIGVGAVAAVAALAFLLS